MAARALPALLVLAGLSAGTGPDSERGRTQLRRVQGLATQPKYGECWSRALERLGARCRELTSESQSRIALRFAYCHLRSSGRDVPLCPEGSEVSRCTGAMDAVAFNTYTEFFTHTHSICHFLQSEAWQSRAENTIHSVILIFKLEGDLRSGEGVITCGRSSPRFEHGDRTRWGLVWKIGS